MATMEFKVRLDDEEDIMQVSRLLNTYLNSRRVEKLQARYGIVTCEEDMEKETLPGTPAIVPDPPPPVEEKTEPEVELDAAGEPWDPDKHSAGKTKIKGGFWRPRRTTKAKEDKPVPPPPENSEGMALEELSYKNMMDVLKGKGLGLDQMNELAKKVGVDSIGLMINHKELIPAVISLAEVQ